MYTFYFLYMLYAKAVSVLVWLPVTMSLPNWFSPLPPSMEARAVKPSSPPNPTPYISSGSGEMFRIHLSALAALSTKTKNNLIPETLRYLRSSRLQFDNKMVPFVKQWVWENEGDDFVTNETIDGVSFAVRCEDGVMFFGLQIPESGTVGTPHHNVILMTSEVRCRRDLSTAACQFPPKLTFLEHVRAKIPESLKKTQILRWICEQVTRADNTPEDHGDDLKNYIDYCERIKISPDKYKVRQLAYGFPGHLTGINAKKKSPQENTTAVYQKWRDWMVRWNPRLHRPLARWLQSTGSLEDIYFNRLTPMLNTKYSRVLTSDGMPSWKLLSYQQKREFMWIADKATTITYSGVARIQDDLKEFKNGISIPDNELNAYKKKYEYFMKFNLPTKAPKRVWSEMKRKEKKTWAIKLKGSRPFTYYIGGVMFFLHSLSLVYEVLYQNSTHFPTSTRKEKYRVLKTIKAFDFKIGWLGWVKGLIINDGLLGLETANREHVLRLLQEVRSVYSKSVME